MKIIKFGLGLCVLLTVLYCGAWFFMAHEINKYTEQYYKVDGPAVDIKFYGEQPKVSGFPFTPIITYTDGFEKDNILIYFDEMRISGFPVPQRPLTIEVDGNIKMVNQNTKINIEADVIDLSFIMPKSLPPSTKKQDMARWQQEVGSITITGANFKNSEVSIHGEGVLGLDKNLQLATKLITKTSGYEEAIQFLMKTGTVKPFVGALAISGLNSMAFTDPVTYKKYVEINILIQDREMFFGPIKIDSLPKIQWH